MTDTLNLTDIERALGASIATKHGFHCKEEISALLSAISAERTAKEDAEAKVVSYQGGMIDMEFSPLAMRTAKEAAEEDARETGERLFSETMQRERAESERDLQTALVLKQQAEIATLTARTEAAERDRNRLAQRVGRFDQLVGKPQAGAHFSHIEVAVKVRMLGRSDLDHEAVCVMARDRIVWLAEKLGDAIARAEKAEAELGRAGDFGSVEMVIRAHVADATTITAERDAALSQVRVLTEALQPFAALGKVIRLADGMVIYSFEHPGSKIGGATVTASDFRRASAALAAPASPSPTVEREFAVKDMAPTQGEPT